MDLTNYYLDAMGIQRWRSKDKLSFETFMLLSMDDDQPQGILSTERLLSAEAAHLLDAMLKAIKLKRAPAEIGRKDLEKKLHIVMGENLAPSVLNASTSFEALREGNQERIKTGKRVLVTYHPGKLLLDQGLKRKAWEDLKLIGS